MKTIKFLFTAVIIGLTLTSCNKDDNNDYDVDFEAQFEQLAIGGFGIQAGFATLEVGASTSSKDNAWNNPKGLSWGQMIAHSSSGKSTETSTFPNIYDNAGSIALETAPDTDVQFQKHIGYFPTSTGVAAGAAHAGRTAWTAYQEASTENGSELYAYALQPGPYTFLFGHVGDAIGEFGPKLGFAASLTTTLTSGPNTTADTAIDLVYSQTLITIAFPADVTRPTVAITAMSGGAEVNGSFVNHPTNSQVAYVYSKSNDIRTISFTVNGKATSFDASGLNFATGAHQNFNVVFNATGGFTIEAGGQWVQTNNTLPGI